MAKEMKSLAIKKDKHKSATGMSIYTIESGAAVVTVGTDRKSESEIVAEKMDKQAARRKTLKNYFSFFLSLVLAISALILVAGLVIVRTMMNYV